MSGRAKMMRALAGLGAVAALVGVIGAIVAPASFFPAYLAMVFALAPVPIGCLFVLMVSCFVGGRWARILAPALEIGAASLPIMGLLFVPVLLGMDWIYPWAREPVTAAAPAFKQVWLSRPFFALRTIVYFAVFSGLAWGLVSARDAAIRRRIAGVGLIAFALLASFAGIDWGMSVEPRFHSSIYGLIFIGQAILAGMSFALLVALWTGEEDPARSGLGALLLSAILLWAYFHAMQYVVIWSADIPLEAAWYVRRDHGVWGGLLWIVALFQFWLPFLALLFTAIRRSGLALIGISALGLLMRPLEAAWLVLPPIAPAGTGPLVFAIASAVAVVCWWLLGLTWLAGRRSPSRLHEPAPG